MKVFQGRGGGPNFKGKIPSLFQPLKESISSKGSLSINSLSPSKYGPSKFPLISVTSSQLPLHSNYNTYKLLIYNLLGSKVYEREFSANNSFKIRLNTDELNLSSGTYFYSIIYANKQTTKKFLLLK